MDYSRLTDKVFVGAAVGSAADVDQLVAAGVTAIVDARVEFDDAAILMAFYPSVLYLYDPTADDGVHPKPVHWFQSALGFALPLIVQPKPNCVLFHCAAGIARGPSLAYCVLRALGWSKDDAFNLIKSKRPAATMSYKDDGDAALLALGYTRD